MKITKRCEYILEDGHKCNAVFSYNSRQGVRKYCHKHVGNDAKNPHLEGHHGLVKSTNKYAAVANAETMQEWVKHQMKIEKIERKRIAVLERKVARLESIVDSITSNKKIVTSVLKEQMKTRFFKERVDAIVVKRLQTSFRILRGEEE